MQDVAMYRMTNSMYELCSFPLALFEKSGISIPRKANKPDLSHAIRVEYKIGTDDEQRPIDGIRYVLDGGALIHRLLWKIGCTYEQLFNVYSNYICCKYNNATIVFDRCITGHTVKDVTNCK